MFDTLKSAINNGVSAVANWQNNVNSYNAQQVNSSRAWQEQMDNTKYQRAKADMEAAGLNWRTLAGGGADASSMPASSMAMYDTSPGTSGMNAGTSLVQSLTSAIATLGSSAISGMSRMGSSVISAAMKFAK